MKPILILLLVFFCVSLGSPAYAQKKLVPVSRSEMTGIAVPAGTKRDSRMFSQAAGRTLLEMESKKENVSVRNIELLTLPSVAASGFNTDSLVAQLTSLGWTITPLATDEKYAWIQKENRYLIAYFSMAKNATELYFGELDGIPPTLILPPSIASGHKASQESGVGSWK